MLSKQAETGMNCMCSVIVTEASAVLTVTTSAGKTVKFVEFETTQEYLNIYRCS